MTDLPEAQPSLNEFDRDEWWDICRTIRPDYPRDEFEADLDEFFRLKAEHLAKSQMN